MAGDMLTVWGYVRLQNLLEWIGLSVRYDAVRFVKQTWSAKCRWSKFEELNLLWPGGFYVEIRAVVNCPRNF